MFYNIMELCIEFTERKEAPAVGKKPGDKDVKEGQKVKLDITATGVPQPEVTWCVAIPLLWRCTLL